MKKKIFAIAVIALCLSVIASGTLAYFTAQETAHNIITSDAVNIDIEEWQDKVGGTPYPDDPVSIMPGTELSKIVTVRNIDAEAYIRAKFEVIVKDANGDVMDLSSDTLDSIISIDINTENWLRKNGDDEWFYYSDAVATGKVTEPLFTEVVFDGPNMTNEYQNCTVEVLVDAQAVQYANNGSDATEADGWPNATESN